MVFQKSIQKITHQIGERFFHLTADNESTINEVRESLHSFLAHMDDIEARAKQAQEDAAKQSEEAPVAIPSEIITTEA